MSYKCITSSEPMKPANCTLIGSKFFSLEIIQFSYIIRSRSWNQNILQDKIQIMSSKPMKSENLWLGPPGSKSFFYRGQNWVTTAKGPKTNNIHHLGQKKKQMCTKIFFILSPFLPPGSDGSGPGPLDHTIASSNSL